MNSDLLVRDLLLYIATVAASTGAVLVGTNVWQGLAALGFSAGVFLLRAFLKDRAYNGK